MTYWLLAWIDPMGNSMRPPAATVLAGVADTDRRAQIAAQAQADKRAARKPGKAKQVFEPPVPKGMGPKKRWALS